MRFKTFVVQNTTRAAAQYIIDNKTTIRETAHEFGLSKSLLHSRLTDMQKYDPDLYAKLKVVLDANFKAKASRGGTAVWNKYKRAPGMIKHQKLMEEKLQKI